MAHSSSLGDLDILLEQTKRDQLDASHPEISSWVSANAGTGKTHVLTMRVLRLLLAGTLPEKILCLTYTKAAAAEMSKRVYQRLGEWVVMEEPALRAALTALTGRNPNKQELSLSRTLFARAIETPGGLKVQTIHAFAERLLQRFPLEAGVAPGFVILDDEDARELRREAIDGVLRQATDAPASALGRALRRAIAFAADDNFDAVLEDALSHREWLKAAAQMEDGELEGLLRRYLSVRPGLARSALEHEMVSVVSEETLQRLQSVLAEGSKSEKELSRHAALALQPNTNQKVEGLSKLLLTDKGSARDRILTVKSRDAHPDLQTALDRAQDRFSALSEELCGLEILEATLSLHTIVDAVMQRFTAAKLRRGAFDFQDLIDRTSALLRKSSSAAWVLYKLDNGLSHILVDESQDTAPSQWRIIEALANEFFAGSGASDETRTIFAVGDEKQSIYSFQGAAPEMFDKMGKDFSIMVAAAGAQWRKVPLNLSFRTVEPLLAAVDHIFSDPARTPGLTVSMERTSHAVKRRGQAGTLEIWPVEQSEPIDDGDPWSPLEDGKRQSPVVRLAGRIADTIKGWLQSGEILQSENRPVRPGDILILVRKRNPFAAPMVAALKMRGIPVAGADRMRLTDQIAIQDLMALGEFLTLPEDDLSLACVLKSPMFGLDDDDLITLAAGRKSTLWKSLLEDADTNERYAFAAGTLKRWRKQADFSPPFEFFSSILDKDRMRGRLLGRLGPDAADGIDEFLNLAITYDEKEPPSLSGFLHAVRQGEREVKRDMEHGRNEVRVMTVHGAKGLEAPIVFLPDTCTTATARKFGGGLIALRHIAAPDQVAPLAWSIKGASRHSAIATANGRLRDAEQKELNRLLYVALTRARDRLYIAGFDQSRRRPSNCWYDTILSGLQPHLPASEDTGVVLRLTSPQLAPHEKCTTDDTLDLSASTLPVWANIPAPREPQPAVPLAPSRLAPYDYDEAGEPSSVEPIGDQLRVPSTGEAPSRTVDRGNALLRGTLTHALLQHLPNFPRATWKKAGRTFLDVQGKSLSKQVKESILTETTAVLEDTAFAPLFGVNSRAEVPVVASIPNPGGKGPPLRITGQIDRLAESGPDILIADYKTNRFVPSEPSSVPEIYLLQLAAYRLAIAQIYPGRTVRAGLLWTNRPRIMEIPPDMLDSYTARLWTLDLSRLDG